MLQAVIQKSDMPTNDTLHALFMSSHLGSHAHFPLPSLGRESLGLGFFMYPEKISIMRTAK